MSSLFSFCQCARSSPVLLSISRSTYRNSARKRVKRETKRAVTGRRKAQRKRIKREVLESIKQGARRAPRLLVYEWRFFLTDTAGFVCVVGLRVLPIPSFSAQAGQICLPSGTGAPHATQRSGKTIFVSFLQSLFVYPEMGYLDYTEMV